MLIDIPYLYNEAASTCFIITSVTRIPKYLFNNITHWTSIGIARLVRIILVLHHVLTQLWPRDSNDFSSLYGGDCFAPKVAGNQSLATSSPMYEDS